MLKAINTKILLAILAALAAIGSAVIYQSHEAHKAAAILQQRSTMPRSATRKMKHFAGR